MKNDTWIGKKGYRYWYYRFRDSNYFSLTLISLATVICLVLLFFVVIPEITNWFSVQQEVEATQQKITVLQKNIAFMNNLDKTILDTQLQTASRTLPSDKDFSSILQSVAYASLHSGVTLNDYSFQIGTIKSSPLVHTLGVQDANNTAPIQIIVVANGKLNSIIKFINDVENSYPLAEVTSIDGSGENVSITIQYYQKPFPNIAFSGDTQLTPLSSTGVKLLQKLSQWDHITGTQQNQSKNQNKNLNIQTVTSTGSALPLF